MLPNRVPTDAAFLWREVTLTFTCAPAGWIIISIVLAVLAGLLGLFPQTLPRAAVWKMRALERPKSVAKSEPELPTSMSGKSLTWRNKVFRTIRHCQS
jgi:hypothetical protein